MDVTGDDHSRTDIAAAVGRALVDVHTGHNSDLDIVVRDEGATRIVPPLPGQGWAAIGIGAPYWAPAAVLTADGQRVLAGRILRTVVVRSLAGAGRTGGDLLLSATAAAVGRSPALGPTLPDGESWGCLGLWWS